MKRIISVVTLVSCIMMAFAQHDPEAQKLLNAVSKKYQSYSTVKIDFAIKGTNHQQQVTVNDKGELLLEPKSNRYRISMQDQEMISDGKVQWTVLKEEQEVQLTNVNNEEVESLTPTNIFTFYRKGFKYASAQDEKVNNKTLSVIELTPEDSKKQFFKVRLRIDKAISQIYDATVFDKSGARYTYTIVKLNPNQQFAAKTFIFDKGDYPGMELVDLR
ncbi:outer membrane lipoprotein carrier protein LolA [Olivibacter sp. SDN3]|uniref:LolA family protein n=1 Tax=Olivibacter sp. SDN3 TaxID=2764720 RepID=UPI001650E1D2|nr:outer membrane lipoprotein carrier protein LolA [Olivibacter sp. SDN3]QNL48337.1 outer membrane lipoprotein carrier protein LolA [Olivibacter sp. SDN3]